MRVCFIWAEKADGEKGREFVLADNFLAGVRAAGDEIVKIRKGEISPKNESGIDADAVCLVGVKSLKLFRLLRKEGKHVIYFDKGYFRHRGPGRTWEYWRVAANDHHPTSYMTKAKHTSERWDIIAGRRRVELKPWRAPDNVGAIVYAGSSEKYHEFAGLTDPTTYANDVIAKVKKLTPRQVIYRPKPTWYDAVPIKNSHFSPRTQSIQDVLTGAWCLLTNGSNASFDAMLAGVPSVVLGNAITRPLYSHRLEDVVDPKIPTDEERDQWLANLAWCMFTEEEMRDGLAWATIKPQLSGDVVDESSLSEVAGATTVRPSKAHLKAMGLWKKKDRRPKRTKAEQRALKPFTKTRTDERLVDE